ncbi:MAG TPA: hypothetical protein PLD37_06695, partial [Usitatibacteraceae bacterium]|nr:hypothetical protein [Usitatibacteraceae bacterium]
MRAPATSAATVALAAKRVFMDISSVASVFVDDLPDSISPTGTGREPRHRTGRTARRGGEAILFPAGPESLLTRVNRERARPRPVAADPGPPCGGP